jgi:hypothetical protein
MKSVARIYRRVNGQSGVATSAKEEIDSSAEGLQAYKENEVASGGFANCIAFVPL